MLHLRLPYLGQDHTDQKRLRVGANPPASSLSTPHPQGFPALTSRRPPPAPPQSLPPDKAARPPPSDSQGTPLSNSLQPRLHLSHPKAPPSLTPGALPGPSTNLLPSGFLNPPLAHSQPLSLRTLSTLSLPTPSSLHLPHPKAFLRTKPQALPLPTLSSPPPLSLQERSPSKSKGPPRQNRICL
jgi:hypothetical protein